MNVFNHKHLVGEKANCVINGNGKIVETNEKASLYPVKVQFCDIREAYTKDGKLFESSKPTLSFGHKEPRVHDYGKPSTTKKCKKKKLNFEKWLKAKDIKLIVYKGVSLSELTHMSKHVPNEWSPKGFSRLLLINTGPNFWDNLHNEWQQAVALAEKTGIPIVFGFKKLLKKDDYVES